MPRGAAQRVSGLPTRAGQVRGSPATWFDGADAHVGIAAAIPALFAGAVTDRAGPLGRPARPDDPGDARPHGGAQPRVVPCESAATPRSGLHPQLCQPQFQRVAVGPRAPRVCCAVCWRIANCTTATARKAPGCVPKKACLDAEVSPEVPQEGASNLLGLDLHLTREKLRDLLQALEGRSA